jgi:hypothetical protein
MPVVPAEAGTHTEQKEFGTFEAVLVLQKYGLRMFSMGPCLRGDDELTALLAS